MMVTVEFGKPHEGGFSLALGHFDGMHLGHRAILRAAEDKAKELGCLTAISTFADNPAGKVPIYAYHDRKFLYSDCGADVCLTLYYSAINGMTGREFFAELMRLYSPKHLACGENYTFGSDLLGASELGDLAAEAGVGLTVVPTVYYCGVKVSSTVIKNYLTTGDVDAARQMLVVPYHMRGNVVSGDGRGHNIGVPTINLRYPFGALEPKRGVYGTYTEIGGRRYRSVTNVGPRPTFMQNKPAVETNLIDYDGSSLLHESAVVYFYRYLRPISKFTSADDLVARINKDKEWTDLC